MFIGLKEEGYMSIFMCLYSVEKTEMYRDFHPRFICGWHLQLREEGSWASIWASIQASGTERGVTIGVTIGASVSEKGKVRG